MKAKGEKNSHRTPPLVNGRLKQRRRCERDREIDGERRGRKNKILRGGSRKTEEKGKTVEPDVLPLPLALSLGVESRCITALGTEV